MINHPDENHDTTDEYRAGRPAEDEEETGVPPDVAAMVGASPEEKRGEAMTFEQWLEEFYENYASWISDMTPQDAKEMGWDTEELKRMWYDDGASPSDAADGEYEAGI